MKLASNTQRTTRNGVAIYLKLNEATLILWTEWLSLFPCVVRFAVEHGTIDFESAALKRWTTISRYNNELVQVFMARVDFIISSN